MIRRVARLNIPLRMPEIMSPYPAGLTMLARLRHYQGCQRPNLMVNSSLMLPESPNTANLSVIALPGMQRVILTSDGVVRACCQVRWNGELDETCAKVEAFSQRLDRWRHHWQAACYCKCIDIRYGCLRTTRPSLEICAGASEVSLGCRLEPLTSHPQQGMAHQVTFAVCPAIQTVWEFGVSMCGT